MGRHGINKLARSYSLKRKTSRALRLHLKELELGPEFIPHPRRLLPAYMVPELGYHGNPISQLTMLCCLKRLTLKTEIVSLYELKARVWSYKLDPVCFFPAENLEHISIDTGYWGVHELIKHLCDQEQVKLVSFQDRQFRNCMRSPASPKYNPWTMDPQNIYRHWETLDLGDIFIKGDARESQQEVLNKLLQCVHLKNLTISLPGKMLQYFIENILPQMTRLETLFIPSGPFDKGVPFVARNLVQTENSLWVKEGDPRQEEDMNRRKWRLEKKHQDNQQIRREIAQALFNSGRPNSHHTGTTMKSRLKYLGLGYRVYTELYAGTSDDGKDRWELFELSPDEAKTFEPIRRQLLEPNNVVRGGICHIKISENFPFGAFEECERTFSNMRLAPAYSNLGNLCTRDDQMKTNGTTSFTPHSELVSREETSLFDSKKVHARKSYQLPLRKKIDGFMDHYVYETCDHLRGHSGKGNRRSRNASSDDQHPQRTLTSAQLISKKM
ncbi:hypothetical protein ACMFMF_000302 [Clarireedia jacksonii]